MKKLKLLPGITGVSPSEPFVVQFIANIFSFIIFILAVWTPFYWYFSIHQVASGGENIRVLWLIWGLFFSELVILVSLVKDKVYYLLSNWLNLFIVLFAFPLFWLHHPLVVLLRIIILYRIFIPVWRNARDFLLQNHLFYTLLVFFTVAAIGGASISLIDPDIKNPWDGVWWAAQTMTTVGYGDIVPKTTAGRIFGIIIMLMGIALISVLTANFSAYLFQHASKSKTESHILHIVLEIQSKIEMIEHKLNKFTHELEKHDRSKK